jgi:hypothetical protein
MSITSANKYKTAANGGTWTAADMNSMQDVFGVGNSIIGTTESRTNVAYGTLTTPDQVANVVVPTNGVVAVLYQATWQESVLGAGRAAIFIGSNQLKTVTTAAAPAVQEVSLGQTGGAALDTPLSTFQGGLGQINTNNAYSGDVTTGQAISVTQNYAGGPCYIFGLPAATYTISIQFKSTSGSVTAKNRKLWVWTLGS